LNNYGNDVKIKAKAWAAAGSDARMNGCEMPVIINSGSGNQGITVSMPVLAYAKEYNIEEEKIYRALVVSNLVAIHQKTTIGRLSAYCGAISAGCAAGCGIAFLMGEDLETISKTLTNSLAITSGVICDGAKASCAAKIAMAVESGIMGYNMCKNRKNFCDGDGIIGYGVENTIRNIGTLASQGMRETDNVIIKIMTEQN
jgi:L-cysteine desulfidase